MSAAITIAMPRMVPNQLLAEAHAKYPESLARAGAEMRWIELDDPEKAVQDALACDGLLLPGGGDIDPKFYGQERIPACGEPNVLRDTAEPLLLRAFLAADKPVLAICRGIQLMNVALGGGIPCSPAFWGRIPFWSTASTTRRWTRSLRALCCRP